MARRLMVTGGGGFVAGSVIRQAGPDWAVTALSRRAHTYAQPGLEWRVLDVRDRDALAAAFAAVRPDAVIHTAALGVIDYCEAHRDEAEAVNAGVTRTVAELCREHGAKLVACSTDNVFDGETGLYIEEDPPNPVNFYGWTKVLGERAVQETGGETVIARLSVVMGLPVLEPGNSFLSRMMETFARGEVAAMPEAEIRSPLDVITAGRALLELADNRYTGIIHVSGLDRLSRYALGQAIADRLGYPRSLVGPDVTPNLEGRAERPRDVSLDNHRARQVLHTPLCGVAEGLELVLSASKEWSR